MSASSHGVPATFHRERHTANLTPCKVLVVQIITFLPLVELLVLLFCEDGEGILRWMGAMKSAGTLCTIGCTEFSNTEKLSEETCLKFTLHM
jgi:hypothetical protein